MTRPKKQEQLCLPELEPAIATTQEGLPALAPTEHASTVRNTPASPADKQTPRIATGNARRKSPAPTVATASKRSLTPPHRSPEVSYNRQEDSLRIQFLTTPVIEDRTSGKLSTGYTVDGHLAEIRIFDLSHQVLPKQAPLYASEDKMTEIMASVREELLFLKAGLCIVLAGVLWLLVR